MQLPSSQLFGGALEPPYSIRFSQIGCGKSVQLVGTDAGTRAAAGGRDGRWGESGPGPATDFLGSFGQVTSPLWASVLPSV